MILSPKGFTGQFVLLCWVVWSVFWIVSAFFVKRTVERRSGMRRGFIVLAVFGLLALLRRSGAIPTSALGYSRAPAVGILADALTFAGLAVTLWSRAALGSNWSGIVAFKENHELVERGPYRFVRHPIYSGILLMVLGTALISGTVSGFALFVLCCLGLWLKARQEERLLARHFPDAYSSYKSRVRAVIPFLL